MAGGTCDISQLQIVENLDSLLKMFSILKSSIQSTGIQKSSNHIFEEYLYGIRLWSCIISEITDLSLHWERPHIIITANYFMISYYKFEFYHEKLFHTSCNFLCATNALLVICHPESRWHMTSSEPRLQAFTYAWCCSKDPGWSWSPPGFVGKSNYTIPIFLLREGW